MQLQEALSASPSLRTRAQIEFLTMYLVQVWPTAAKLGDQRVADIARAASLRQAVRGEDVVTEGDVGTTFYILISGELAVYKKGLANAIVKLKPGTTFGEQALSRGAPRRNASIRVESAQADMLELRKTDYDHIMRDYHESERRRALECLQSMRVFRDWTEARLERLCSKLQHERYDKGAAVITQGEAPHNVYFVLQGRCEVTKALYERRKNRWPSGTYEWTTATKLSKRLIPLMEYGPATFFGEDGIVENQPRAFTVTALTECTLLALERRTFVSLVHHGEIKLDAPLTSEELTTQVESGAVLQATQQRTDLERDHQQQHSHARLGAHDDESLLLAAAASSTVSSSTKTGAYHHQFGPLMNQPQKIRMSLSVSRASSLGAPQLELRALAAQNLDHRFQQFKRAKAKAAGIPPPNIQHLAELHHKVGASSDRRTPHDATPNGHHSTPASRHLLQRPMTSEDLAHRRRVQRSTILSSSALGLPARKRLVVSRSASYALHHHHHHHQQQQQQQHYSSSSDRGGESTHAAHLPPPPREYAEPSRRPATTASSGRLRSASDATVNFKGTISSSSADPLSTLSPTLAPRSLFSAASPAPRENNTGRHRKPRATNQNNYKDHQPANFFAMVHRNNDKLAHRRPSTTPVNGLLGRSAHSHRAVAAGAPPPSSRFAGGGR